MNATDDVKPFYLEEEGVWLLPITNEQADALYLDTSIWACSPSVEGTGWYACRPQRLPSMYTCPFAIQVNPPEDDT